MAHKSDSCGQSSLYTAAAAQLLGKQLVERIQSARLLVVGSGGIGCEVLKGLIGAGFRTIEVVDLDTIDLSNLNRQFLFQHNHIKQSKAIVASQAVQHFGHAPDPDVGVQITPHHNNIFEAQFDLAWYRSFDLILNALDNLEARRRVNLMCMAAGVPLVESGTAGYQGQVIAIVPKQAASDDDSKHMPHTECFDCQPQPVPKTFPICTIRSTPSTPIHCVVWAKDYLFAHLFGVAEDIQEDQSPQSESGDGDPDSSEAKEIAQLREETAALVKLRDSVHTASPDCAKMVFDKVFSSDVHRLLCMDEMWADRPRKPTPLDYDTVSNSVTSATESSSDSATDSSLRDQRIWSLEQALSVWRSSLNTLAQTVADGSNGDQLSFDKDDDAMLDFVTATAYLRAYIFGIPVQSRFQVKQMAGNIIPAIATANAMVGGMMIIQAIKLLNNASNLKAEQPDQFVPMPIKNTFMRYGQGRPSRFYISTRPDQPNPKCAVCSNTFACAVLNANETTLGQFIDALIASIKESSGGDDDIDEDDIREELSIEESGRLLYDMDLDDNLGKSLKQLNINPGSTVTVVRDPSTSSQSVKISFTIVHSLDAEGVQHDVKPESWIPPLAPAETEKSCEDDNIPAEQPGTAIVSNGMVDLSSDFSESVTLKRKLEDNDATTAAIGESVSAEAKRSKVEESSNNGPVSLDEDDDDLVAL
ncbi:hypothetical protein GQ42DRAFT_162855 [Ramicandelaber brevisporus]|nr:hypothetical protein GQ42DRAFT_162855 [Ramicandelaber brevisporus]